MELRFRYNGQELVVPRKAAEERLDRRSSVPLKRSTRLRRPITYGSSAYYGNGVSSEPTTALWVLKDRPERGCGRVATQAEEARLQNSARNANTTRR